jgi:hypothetical protein
MIIAEHAMPFILMRLGTKYVDKEYMDPSIHPFILNQSPTG